MPQTLRSLLPPPRFWLGRAWLSSCLIALVVSCGPPVPDEPSPNPLADSATPSPETGLRASDAILDLALAADGGLVHLAWSAAIASARGVAPSYRTVYAHSENRGRNWSAPLVIDDTLGTPRLVAAGDLVALVTGIRLLAFRSRDGGRSWDEPISLLPRGARKVAAFDAAFDGEDLVVACVLQPSTPYATAQRSAEHRQRVVIVRLAADGVARETELGRFAPSLRAPARPRIVVAGDLIQLAVGLNLDRGEIVDGDASESVRERSLLAWFETDVGGRAWSAPRIIDLTTDGDEIRRLEDLDFVRIGDTTHLFLTGHAVHVVSSTAEGRWSRPRRLNPYDIRLSRGELRAPALAAAALGGQGRVVWIDHRYRRSDRRPWNPLGGLPWSDDDPMWADNDVFSLSLSAAVDLVVDGIPPERITAPASFARAVEVAASDDRFLVAWSGRTNVGKDFANNEAPRIFLTSMPAHSADSTTTR